MIKSQKPSQLDVEQMLIREPNYSQDSQQRVSFIDSMIDQAVNSKQQVSSHTHHTKHDASQILDDNKGHELEVDEEEYSLDDEEEEEFNIDFDDHDHSHALQKNKDFLNDQTQPGVQSGFRKQGTFVSTATNTTNPNKQQNIQTIQQQQIKKFTNNSKALSPSINKIQSDAMEEKRQLSKNNSQDKKLPSLQNLFVFNPGSNEAISKEYYQTQKQNQSKQRNNNEESSNMVRLANSQNSTFQNSQINQNDKQIIDSQSPGKHFAYNNDRDYQYSFFHKQKRSFKNTLPIQLQQTSKYGETQINSHDKPQNYLALTMTNQTSDKSMDTKQLLIGNNPSNQFLQPQNTTNSTQFMNSNNDRTYKNRPQMDYFNSPNAPQIRGANQIQQVNTAAFTSNRHHQDLTATAQMQQVPLKIKISKKKINYSTHQSGSATQNQQAQNLNLLKKIVQMQAEDIIQQKQNKQEVHLHQDSFHGRGKQSKNAKAREGPQDNSVKQQLNVHSHLQRIMDSQHKTSERAADPVNPNISKQSMYEEAGSAVRTPFKVKNLYSKKQSYEDEYKNHNQNLLVTSVLKSQKSPKRPQKVNSSLNTNQQLPMNSKNDSDSPYKPQETQKRRLLKDCSVNDSSKNTTTMDLDSEVMSVQTKQQSTLYHNDLHAKKFADLEQELQRHRQRFYNNMSPSQKRSEPPDALSLQGKLQLLEGERQKQVHQQLVGSHPRQQLAQPLEDSGQNQYLMLSPGVHKHQKYETIVNPVGASRSQMVQNSFQQSNQTAGGANKHIRAQSTINYQSEFSYANNEISRNDQANQQLNQGRSLNVNKNNNLTDLNLSQAEQPKGKKKKHNRGISDNNLISNQAQAYQHQQTSQEDEEMLLHEIQQVEPDNGEVNQNSKFRIRKAHMVMHENSRKSQSKEQYQVVTPKQLQSHMNKKKKQFQQVQKQPQMSSKHSKHMTEPTPPKFISVKGQNMGGSTFQPEYIHVTQIKTSEQHKSPSHKGTSTGHIKYHQNSSTNTLTNSQKFEQLMNFDMTQNIEVLNDRLARINHQTQVKQQMLLHQKYKNAPEEYLKSIYKQNVIKQKHDHNFAYVDNGLVANSQFASGHETFSGEAQIPNSILKHKQQEYKLSSNGQLKVVYTNVSNHDLQTIGPTKNRRSNKVFRNTSLGGARGCSNQDLRTIQSPSKSKSQKDQAQSSQPKRYHQSGESISNEVGVAGAHIKNPKFGLTFSQPKKNVKFDLPSIDEHQ